MTAIPKYIVIGTSGVGYAAAALQRFNDWKGDSDIPAPQVVTLAEFRSLDKSLYDSDVWIEDQLMEAVQEFDLRQTYRMLSACVCESNLEIFSSFSGSM